MFTFIDLCAGVGGFRLAFERVGGKCVFTSEKDKECLKTIYRNFDGPHNIVEDLWEIHPPDVPDHDVLLAGFPCQSFSVAGSRKGFADEEKGGNVFMALAHIINEKKPRCFLLENVVGLMTHDGGDTFASILRTLKEVLGYHVSFRVFNAMPFTPQSRKRVFIAGVRGDHEKFSLMDLRVPHPYSGEPLGSILEPAHLVEHFAITDKYFAFLKRHKKEQAEKGNNYGYRVFNEKSLSYPCIRTHPDKGNHLIAQRKGLNPRFVTPRECARLMGFPDSFVLADKPTAAYRQMGNSVVVPLVEKIAEYMVPHIVH